MASSSDLLVVVVPGLIVVAALFLLSLRELCLALVAGVFMAVLVVGIATVIVANGHPAGAVEPALIGLGCP